MVRFPGCRDCSDAIRTRCFGSLARFWSAYTRSCGFQSHEVSLESRPPDLIANRVANLYWPRGRSRRASGVVYSQ
eukprot:3784006-Prymnesium_polylepis.1